MSLSRRRAVGVGWGRSRARGRLLASIAVLWFILSEIDTAEVLAALASKSREQLAYAAAFAALSYLLLIGYDAIGLRQLGLKLPFATTALGSYTSFAISFTLGFPLVTAGTVRYWIYARKGVRPPRSPS